MKTKVFSFLGLIFLLVFGSQSSFAFIDKTFSVGVGYYSQNFLNKVAKEDSGKKGLFGETFYPLNFQYDYEMFHDWFVGPRLSYTLLPRKSAGDTAKVSFYHLVFPIGRNITAGSSDQVWDWYAGPGLLQYKIEGAGGTVQMNNGTGTATFAVPGDTATIRKVTVNLGTSYSIQKSRFGFDISFENAFSSTKRSQNLMLSYAYLFGGR